MEKKEKGLEIVQDGNLTVCCEQGAFSCIWEHESGN